MKKTTLTVFIIVIAMFGAKAQDSLKLKASPDTYKQQAGNSSLEVNFNPGNIFGSGSGNPFGLLDGGIKYRYFLSENTALRTIVKIGFSNTSQIMQQADPDFDLLELKNTYRSYSVLLKPGLERHFMKYNRLSPYIGSQLLIGYKTGQRIEENQDNQNIYLTKWKNDPGYLTIGTNVFAGFDYYFVKKLYFGLEIGYGITYQKQLKYKYINKKYPEQNYEIKKGSFIGLSPSMATGNIRFGWTF